MFDRCGNAEWSAGPDYSCYQSCGRDVTAAGPADTWETAPLLYNTGSTVINNNIIHC